jgi:hypothetical protein
MTILSRIKDKFKKILQKKKALPQDYRKETLNKEKEEVLGAQETVIEKSKFSSIETREAPPRYMPQDLPNQYGRDKIVLQVRDHRWLHAYWEVTMPMTNKLKQRLGDAFSSAKWVLRVYDVSFIAFDGTNANRFFDIELTSEVNNWYIDTNGPGRSWCVDLGLRLANGEFITIVRSNTVATPIEGPSWVTDEEWMIPEEMFARLYGMGFGLGRSSPVGKAWQERIKQALFSGGVSSLSSPAKKLPKERKFWLWVNTELIVYGATEPDALVTVQGRPIELRPDGTFSLRFALPEGKQVIPVKATSSDRLETKSVTPVVTKKTHS